MRLTGLSAAQLRYWHDSGLLEASRRAGSRGVPRLYSWVDYLRLQIAAELHTRLATSTIRAAMTFLDTNVPNWYMLPVRVQHGHVETERGGARMLADAAGQYLLSDADGSYAAGTAAAAVSEALEAIAHRGELGQLHTFSDAVIMHPAVNLAQPTLAGTALETQFVAGMVVDIGGAAFAAVYRLPPDAVERAVEFERAVA
jgi:DNA-binding transcriptional MerR regulator